MLSAGSSLLATRAPARPVQPVLPGRSEILSRPKAAASHSEEVQFRRPDVPAEDKGFREQHKAAADPQLSQSSDALVAAGIPRSPLEQVCLQQE